MATTTEPEITEAPAVFEVSDVGPVEHFRAVYNPAGCILQLLGEEGVGKSTILNAAKRMHGGKGKLSKRDKSLKGTASGFGVRLTVSQSTTVRGELAFTSLEDQCGLETLVDPKLDDPLAADRERIKSLVKLVGVEADASLFWPLVGGQQAFESIVKLEKCDDLVVMYGRVKRAIQAAAREKEKQQANAELNATSARQAAAGIDTTAEANSEKLQHDLEFAIAQQAELQQAGRSAKQVADAAAEARNKMETAVAGYTGPAVSVAHTAHDESIERRNACLAVADKARKALEFAEQAVKDATAAQQSAAVVLKAATDHQSFCGQWRDQIEKAEQIIAPAPEEFEEAAAAVTAARQANDLGVLVRQARAKLADAESHDDNAKTLAREAQQLRDADKGCDEVLSGIVTQLGTPLRIVDGRLVTDTERGDTYYADLSTGQRCRIAAKIGIEAVDMFAIDQEIWQALSPKTQAEIWQDVQDSHTVVLVGKVADGPLRSEIFTPNGKHEEA